MTRLELALVVAVGVVLVLLVLLNYTVSMLRVQQPVRLLDTTRYVITLTDWADTAPQPEMRWRWVVTAADPVSDTLGPVLMLGNAPTYTEAQSEAASWVLNQGGTEMVVKG